MNKEKFIELREQYDDMLRNNVLKFWLDNSLDKKNGGYFSAIDRTGNVIDTDKSVWVQGRFAWILSTMYSYFGKEEKYLDAAKLGIDFINKHCFDEDERMFFKVTEDGKPLVKRLRYFFSETFALLAMGTYGKASGDKTSIDKARHLLTLIEKYRTTDGILVPKVNQDTRPYIGFGVPMIMLATIQEMRDADPDNKEEYNRYADENIKEMMKFVKEEHKVVMEALNKDGSIDYDRFDGRLLNPGHAIEGAWFIMHEGYIRNNEEYKKLGIKMFDWMWEWGWDKKHGGIIYYQDVLNKPKSEYWHDMKFWWPQNEASIASLYAYLITKDEDYLKKHMLVMDYSEKFIDREYGEWFGYLHMDGRISTELKGNMYKGPFHIPRMYIRNIQLIDKILVEHYK